MASARMLDLKIGNKIIKRQTPIEFLQIMLNENLSWKDLIKTVENKLKNWLDKIPRKVLLYEMIKNSTTFD